VARRSASSSRSIHQRVAMQRALAGRLSKAQACTCEHAARLRLPAPRVSVQSTRFARRGCTLALQPQRRRPAQQRAARLHAVNKVWSFGSLSSPAAVACCRAWTLVCGSH